MVLFPIIGLLIWVAFLCGVMVLCGVVWAAGKSVWWFLDAPDRLDRRKAKAVSSAPRVAPPAPVRRAPSKAPAAPPVRPDARDSSGIWPKWTPSHRLYKDYELALWQEQFDALNSRQ